MRNISIQLKIIIGLILFTIFIVTLERYLLSENIVKQFIESKKSKNELLVNTIAPVIGLNISLGLHDANKDYLNQIVEQNSDLAYIELTDLNGKTIYSYLNKSNNSYKIDDEKINFSNKMIIDNITGDALATISLHFLNTEYQVILDNNRETTFKIFALTLILLVLFILLIKREFRHLNSLSQNVLLYDPKINNLNLEISDRKDEVGIIHNAILSMVKKIKEHSRVLDEVNISLEEKVKQRTLELEYTNNEFKYMLDHTMEGIAIFENGKCINLNKAAINIFGYSNDKELLGKSPLIFIAPQSHEATIEKIKEKNLEPYESIGVKQDGTKFPILLKDTTFQNNNIQYRITSILDLTKIKDNEKLLELAKLKAEESTKAKSDFLANMSHEIRTPMNGIVGMTHLVKQTKLDAKQMSYLTKIETASNNLLNIINDILDFSKAEAGKLNIEHIDFDMNDVISNVKNLVEYKAKERNLNFNIFYSDKNSMFHGDQLRISQILINLMSNAIKFTEIGSVELYIESLADNTTRFIVKDTGIGLTPEQQSKLFKSFSQADDSITRKYGGTGLGLSISKQLVELMDGKIWVESEINEGSKFIFELKLSKGDIKKLKKSSIKSLGKLKNEINATKHSNILLVEDNKTNQAVIIGLLEDLNIDIDIANNGQEAIELYQINSNKYKLIFMDIQMPIIDGISATKIIRDIDKKIPIVALTANVMKEDIENIKLAGMNEYLSKPIEVEKLYEILLKYLSQD